MTLVTAKIRKLLYCARIRARARPVNYRYFTIKNQPLRRVRRFFQNKGLFFQNKGLFLQNKGLFLQNKKLFLQNKGLFLQNKGLFLQNKGLFLQNKGLFPQNKRHFLRKVLDYLTKPKSLSPTTLEVLIHDVAIPPINPRPLICPSFFFRKFAGREQDAQTIFLQDQHKWN